MISTRARYALRILVDLAEHDDGLPIPMKEIAERQELSLKYVERILPLLVKEGQVTGVHGKGGGYRLMKAPEDLTVWEVLLVAEGEMAPVACLSKDAPNCTRSPVCRTLPVWKRYYEITEEYFSSLTLRDLMKTGHE